MSHEEELKTGTERKRWLSQGRTGTALWLAGCGCVVGGPRHPDLRIHSQPRHLIVHGPCP